MDANNNNNNKKRRSPRVKEALQKKRRQEYAEWIVLRDKKMLQRQQQSVSVAIGNYSHLHKITSATREVIIENDGGTPGFNKHIIEFLSKHHENPQLTDVKCGCEC